MQLRCVSFWAMLFFRFLANRELEAAQCCSTESSSADCPGVDVVPKSIPRCSQGAEAIDERLLNRTERVMAAVVGMYSKQGLVVTRSDVGDHLALEGVETGYSSTWADLELFLQLEDAIAPRRIFGVGNGFGFSTLALATIFSGARIDVIDAGADAPGNVAWINRTNDVSRQQGFDVHVVKGFSPKDVRRVARRKIYDLAFIDGCHTQLNQQEDFMATLPHMAPQSVIVFHDVAYAELAWGMKKLLSLRTDFGYVDYHGVNFLNEAGTGFMHRGFKGGLLERMGAPFAQSRHRQRCTKY